MKEKELRDHFAGIALRSLITGRTWGHLEISDDELINTWAKTAYALADCMMEARKNEHKPV